MRLRVNRTARVAGLVACAFLTAIGALVAEAVVQERSFTGRRVTAGMGLVGSDGRWRLIDEIVIPDLRFDASVRDMASSKAVATHFVYDGMSTTRNKRVRVTMTGPSTAHADLTTGHLDLNVPLLIDWDGKAIRYTVPMSTETAQGGTGTISGRRAMIDKIARTASLIMVGSSTMAIEPGLRNQLLADPSLRKMVEDAGPAARMQIFVTVDGTIAAKK